MSFYCDHGHKPLECVECETKRQGRAILDRDAEIEQLKLEKAGIQGSLAGQLWRAQAEIERLRKINEIVVHWHDYYQSRAAAWKGCAKRWMGVVISDDYVDGRIQEDEFLVIRQNTHGIATIPVRKFPSSFEDKSALDETNQKPDSSES